MRRVLPVLAATIAAFALATLAQAGKGPAYTDPEKADADFPIQGEYSGTVKTEHGDVKVGIQVIALGDGLAVSLLVQDIIIISIRFSVMVIEFRFPDDPA